MNDAKLDVGRVAEKDPFTWVEMEWSHCAVLPLFWSETGLEVVKSDDIRCRVSASLCDLIFDIFDAPVRDVGTNGEEWFTIITKDSGL